MKFLISVTTLLIMNSVALAAETEPKISGPLHGSRDLSTLASKAQALVSGLRPEDTLKLDQITSAAAARAVIALQCEDEGFSRVSKRIESVMDAKVTLATTNTAAAKTYARDSALLKYKAMAIANKDSACDSLTSLVELARSEGFMEE